MAERLITVVSMLIAAFLLAPYAHFIIYPLIALITYLLFFGSHAVLKRLFPRLDTSKGRLTYLAIFLLLLFCQFLYFNSRSTLAHAYLGDLSAEARIVDHHVCYTYDPSFTFLIDNSNGVLDKLLLQREFGIPESYSLEQNDYVLSHVPKSLAERFRGIPLTRYRLVDENGTCFSIIVANDKSLFLYQVLRT